MFPHLVTYKKKLATNYSNSLKRSKGRIAVRRIFVFAVIAVAFVCLSGIAAAQTQFGTITGRVADPNGAVVPGARVTLSNVTNSVKNDTTTDAEGNYLFGNVFAGTYEITVEKEGFGPSKRRLTVEVGGRVDADITLQVGTLGGTVTVTDETPVNTTTGELSRTVNEKEIMNLPLITRNPYALVSLAPGASDTGAVTGDVRGLGLAVNGMRTSSINFMLDGGENNDTFFAGVGQNIPLDAVQEFRVQTNAMTAEFGRNAIVTNVVTKSGSNSLHGSLYEFYRGSDLASSTFDDNASGTPKSNYVRNQFGGSAGGRIIKDKTFFFGSYEGVRVRSQGSARYFIPTQNFLTNASPTSRAFITGFGGLPAATDPIFITARQIIEDIEQCGPYGSPGCDLRNSNTGAVIAPDTPMFQRTTIRSQINAGGGNPQNSHLFTGRIDHRISNKTSFLGRYAFENTLLFPGTVSLSPYEGFNTGQRARNQNLNLTFTHTFSPSMVNETRLIYNRVFQNQPLGAAPGTVPCWQYDFFGNTPTGDIIALPGYVPDVCAFAGIPFGGPQNIYQGYTGFTKLHGKHTLKAGGQMLHMRDNRSFGAYENGYFDTFAAQGLLDGQVDFIFVAIDPNGHVPGDVYSTATDGPFKAPSFTRHYRYNEFAVYAEDQYKWSQRLTFTAGLRWEYFGVHHSPKNEQLLDANLYLGAVGGANQSLFQSVANARFRRTSQFYKQDWNNIAPRVGFAWDIKGNGKSVLRGGYGLFFDRNFGNATFNAIQNPPNYAVISLVPLGSFGVSNAPVNVNQFNTLAAIGGANLTISSSARMLDNDLETAYSAQWNVTFSQELKNFVTEFSYIGSNGYKLYSLNNLNQLGSCLLLPGITCVPGGGRTSRLNQTGLTGMNRRGNEGLSRYKGFSVDVRSRLIGQTGLSLRGNYTWSHSRDNSSSFFGDSPFEANFGFGFRDPFNPAGDLADSTNDIRHRASISGTWDTPWHKQQNGLGQLLGGWTINGIFQGQTGGAFTVYDNSDSQCNNSGTNFCLPVVNGAVPGITQTPSTTLPNTFTLYSLGSAFRTQEAFCAADPDPLACTARLYVLQSNLLSPRNLFRTPGYWNLDASVLKNIKLPWEGKNLQLRAEFFNVLNHSNLFAVPGTNQFTGSGSVVTAKRGVTPAGGVERRIIQLAVRFTF
jgi:hypothetical protein